MLGLVALLSTIVLDTAPRFSRDTVEIKRQHNSAQRNWNVFYGQNYVFDDGALKYQADFVKLESVIEPDAIALTDLATSYYLASHLPLYVKNVHRHHSVSIRREWRMLIQSKHACFLDQPARKSLLVDFVRTERARSSASGAPEFLYLVVNKDQINRNMKLDCLSQSRSAFVKNIDDVADIIFDGEFLRVYKIIDRSATGPLEHRKGSSDHDIEVE